MHKSFAESERGIQKKNRGSNEKLGKIKVDF